VTKHEQSFPHDPGGEEWRPAPSTHARSMISAVTSYVSEIESSHAYDSAVQIWPPVPLDPHTLYPSPIP
jgi:hypothetical protein